MLLFTEGFDWMGNISDAITYGKWVTRFTGLIGNTSSIQRFGAGSGNYWLASDSRHSLTRNIGSNLSAGILGIAFRADFSGTNAYRAAPFILLDGTTVQLGVKLNTDLTFSIIRGGTNTVLGTSTYTLPTATWVYLELKWKISDSIASGDVVLYADGVAILTLAAGTDTKNTANAYATAYQIGGADLIGETTVAMTTTYMDDHYFMDLTGTTNNAPVGSVRIQTLFPSGDGNSSQFVGSDGNSTNNSLLVDETAVNTTDYVESGTIGNKDTYAFQDSASTTTTIYGVSVNVVAIRTDAGARSITDVIRSGGSDYNGSAIALNTTYTNHQTVHETNPNTGSGWTKSGVDGAEFGIRVDS